MYSEKEAANDILRSVVDMFESIRDMEDINVWNDLSVMEYQNIILTSIQSHMLELPERIYRELELLFDTEISCIFGGDTGMDSLYESHIKEEYLEEIHESNNRKLDIMEIALDFLPYVEKRILGRLREIFKDYIPK